MARNPRVEIYESRSRFPRRQRKRWRLVAGNGEVVIPVEGHTHTADVKRAIAHARRLLNDPDLEIMEVSRQTPQPRRR